jgi:hypothetical protein
MLGRLPKEMHAEIMPQIKKNAVTAVKVLKESPFESGFLVEMEATRKADGKPRSIPSRSAIDDLPFERRWRPSVRDPRSSDLT